MRCSFRTLTLLLSTFAALTSGPGLAIDTSAEERFCEEIGFKPRSADFANCVIDFLGRVPRQGRASLVLESSISQPGSDGSVTITVKSNLPLSSLQVNGVEEGASQAGRYSIKRLPPVNQLTTYKILARDALGQSASSVVTVNRVQEKVAVRKLNPLALKPPATERDAVAIIVGVESYRRIPKSEYSASDARMFYEYATRALGIPQSKIKILIDDEADRVGIRHALEAWLPSVVAGPSTEIFVFFSGHGLPSQAGDSLYILPWDVDRLYLEDTAVSNEMIYAAIQSVGAKQALIILDSCYSGTSRTGETLLASARPIAVKAKHGTLPDGVTLLSAASPDEISYSSNELKHGVFSFHLMQGLEGKADQNNDGLITTAEMFEYVRSGVERDSLSNGTRQRPALNGSRDFVLTTSKK